MKKHELLEIIDNELLDKLYGFCYARTDSGYEGQELCSDIILALVQAANTEGDITNPYPFIWQVARNVYADFSKKRRQQADALYQGDPEDVLPWVTDGDGDGGDEDDYLLKTVYHRISFLTRAYRESMIAFYIDGLSTAEIAKCQGTSETTVRQRLFSARKKIKSEVNMMTKMSNNRPVALDNIDFVMWGNGDPSWDDPRKICTRQFSKHILWLCRKKPMNAAEIAEELNVPTLYVEDELEVLVKGQYGKYGMLRRLENGKYALNFILIDKETIEKAHGIYTEQLPRICDIISGYIQKHKEEYLSFPYLNRKVDMNLVLWQQVSVMAYAFSGNVERILKEKYFQKEQPVDRPFSIFGYEDNGKRYGGSWNATRGENICGYSEVKIENIGVSRIREHFYYGMNISNNIEMQLALRAVDGLDPRSLSEVEKEAAAKAVQRGYLYREGEMLYTNILVCDLKDFDRLFDISKGLEQGYFEEEAQAVAGKIAVLLRNAVPDYLMGEWRFANDLFNLPTLDTVVEFLVGKGVLTPPEDGIGAEGCWAGVSRLPKQE